jgi:hypothetical protein
MDGNGSLLYFGQFCQIINCYIMAAEIATMQSPKGTVWTVPLPKNPLYAHIELRPFVVRPGLLGYLRLRKRIVELPVVSFANGRHQAHFVHAMGVKAFPAEVHKDQARMMRKFCGA